MLIELNKCMIALTTLTICPLIFQLASGLSIDQSAPSRQSNSLASTNSLNSNQSPPRPTAADSDDPRMPDMRRPIWNLAHMVNSIKELDYRLGKGANAVEADVTFGRDGDPLFTYHGPPCDCWRHCHQREDFNDYLSYVREIAIDDQEGGGKEENRKQEQDINTDGERQQQSIGKIGQNLTLLFLDLKLDYLDQKSKARAGAELAKSIVENLFIDKATSSNSSWPTEGKQRGLFRLILSVNHVGDVELVNNFIYNLEKRNSSHLLERIGFDVGMNDDLHQIETMWKRFGRTLNLWQGDGYTNCISPFYNLERLTKALLKRNQDLGYPRKIYQWTIDLHDRMRESLQLGVDAIMTNHPERLISVLNEPDVIHNCRLATRKDNPFEKISQHPGSRFGGDQVSARYQRSASPPSGGIFRSLMDIINSWVTYIKEIPFLSFPTTSRLIPRVKRHRQKSFLPQIVNPNSNSASLEAKRNGAGDREKSHKIEAGEQVASNNKSIQASTNSTANNSLTARNSAEERSSSTISDATTISSTNSSNSSEQDAASGSNEEQAGIISQQPYEGPKWYTSLVSNVLVSMLKIALPAS